MGKHINPVRSAVRGTPAYAVGEYLYKNGATTPRQLFAAVDFGGKSTPPDVFTRPPLSKKYIPNARHPPGYPGVVGTHWSILPHESLTMSAQIKARPILFSGAMVRALLDGSKTQTRRALKVRCQEIGERDDGSRWPWSECPDTAADHWHACPYGQPGDRLWVRETWGVVSNAWDDDGNLVDWLPDRPATAIADMPFGQGYYSGHAIYAADGSYEWAGDDDGGGEPRSAWHPSIHMPRAASRILLQIVSVRVERLHAISEADAWGEGIEACCGELDYVSMARFSRSMGRSIEDAVPSYAALWESINGAGSWDANPWVWVVEFKRVMP